MWKADAPPSLRHRSRCAVFSIGLWLACGMGSGTATAQSADSAGAPQPPTPTERRSGTLTLQQALDLTLDSSLDIQIVANQLLQGEGELMAADSLYDPLISSSYSRSLTQTPALSAGSETTRHRNLTVVSWNQTLLSGLQLTPSFSVDQIKFEDAGNPGLSTGTLSLEVTAPLMENRGGKIGRLARQAAAGNLEGDRWTLNHQRSITVFSVAVSYWGYVSAQRQLEVFIDSEGRAERLVDELTQLVDRQERPASDLIQLRANAAAKRSDRFAAEQAVTDARRTLGLQIGLSGGEISRLPLPAEGFPKVEAYDIDPETVQRLAAIGKNLRADLESALRQEESAELLYAANEDLLKPRLDLTVAAGYSGADRGIDFEPFLGSVIDNVRGLNATVLLRLDLPLKNTSSRGNLMISQSTRDTERLQRQDIERSIESGVEVAVEALRRSAQQANEAELSVQLSRQTVANEREKNRLGVSTLFDVILAEDRLTSALLNEVGARQSYANAIASLRFQTGTLIADRGAAEVAEARRLTRPPSPEEE